METRFTPGDWTVFMGENDRPGIESNAGVTVVVWGDKESDFDDAGVRGSTDDEAIANAHLISASKDLYTSLQQAFEMIDGVLLIDVFGAEWFEKANAALNKAANAA